MAYLDTITKDKNIIKPDWYQKSISSGRLINFYSKHPKNIINTANNFIRRVLQISDISFHKNNIKKIKTILNKNGFPLKISNNLLNRQLMNKTKDTNKPDKMYKSMPYIPELSERLRKSDLLDKNKYMMTLTTHNTMKKLYSNMKTKMDKNGIANVIYQIDCKGNDTEQCNKLYKNKIKV